MSIDRKSARRLAVEGTKAGMKVLGGQLLTDGNQVTINKTDLMALFEQLGGQNVLLLVSAVDDEEEELVKTCLTCGAEFTEDECPKCALVRDRLRG